MNNRKIKVYCFPCNKPIEGELINENNKAYVVKNCEIHGSSKYLIENDFYFLDKIYSSLENARRNFNFSDMSCNKHSSHANLMTAIDITSKCNLHCKHCYYEPDNKTKDKSLERIKIELAQIKTPEIILVGAEPTVREDIHLIIKEVNRLGKKANIQTNGLKLHDISYVKYLKEAGISKIGISIHYEYYHGKAIYDRIIKGLWNTIVSGIQISRLAFVVASEEEALLATKFLINFEKKYNLLRKAINIPFKLEDISYYMYTPIKAGRHVKEDPDYFLSDLHKLFKKSFDHFNILYDENLFDGTNTPYEAVIKTGLEGSLTILSYTASPGGLDKDILDNNSNWDYFMNSDIEHIAHSLNIERSVSGNIHDTKK